MSDTQNLTVTVPVHTLTDNTTTPSRRGHCHKRSFAISGDFEFLKQPPQLQGQDSSFPQQSLGPQSIQNTKNIIQDAPKLIINEPNSTGDSDGISGGSGNNISSGSQHPFQSPRFFASEEPTFSSPFRGVPDAIINLDDALKAKPRSFKSHRRTESAPAELQFLLSAKPMPAPAPRIEEEDMSDIEESDVSNSPRSNRRKNKGQTNPGLLSPLRPYTDLHYEDKRKNDGDESPLHSRTITPNDSIFNNYNHSDNSTGNANNKHNIYNEFSSNVESGTNLFLSQFSDKSQITSPWGSSSNNNHVNNTNSSGGPAFAHNLTRSPYNSLKINRQKQRSYNRQLPMTAAAGTVQSQTLKEKSSTTSLSSTYLISPTSQLHSPSKPISTPGTPISFSYKQKLSSGQYIGPHNSKLGSNTPLHSFQQRSSVLRPSSASTHQNNRFNFESKEYDLDYNKLDDFNDQISNGNNRDNDTKKPLDGNLGQISEPKKNNPTILSNDLLLGEPGDMVDLSSVISPVKSITKTFDSLRIGSTVTSNNDLYLNSGASSKVSLNSSYYENSGRSRASASGKDTQVDNTQTTYSQQQYTEKNSSTPEQRSVSDTAVIMNEQRSKGKSRLRALKDFFK